MKIIYQSTLTLLIAVLLMPVSKLTAQTENDNKYNISSIKSKGVQVPEENFTGTAWVNMVVGPRDDLNSAIGKVTFEAKARTNWHAHPGGQILIVTDGVGYYQEKGKPIQTIREGDVVKIPGDVAHWHGASHNSSMAHTAIGTNRDEGSTEWLGPVTDEEYNSTASQVK